MVILNHNLDTFILVHPLHRRSCDLCHTCQHFSVTRISKLSNITTCFLKCDHFYSIDINAFIPISKTKGRKCYQPAINCLSGYNRQSVLCLKDYKSEKTIVSVSEAHLGLMYIHQQKLGRGSNLEKWCICPS